ncbi:hypothetical protein K0M31_000641 [Melipona bicolor]|uniref:Uncharacterized protein n=1 Tax=Melipona bicolor TaxID=60889 RepID=A0AA40GE85_9HYME|nr:hypothetical protein K0M31_000641 [Melipona bicolor]
MIVAERISLAAGNGDGGLVGGRIQETMARSVDRRCIAGTHGKLSPLLLFYSIVLPVEEEIPRFCGQSPRINRHADTGSHGISEQEISLYPACAALAPPLSGSEQSRQSEFGTRNSDSTANEEEQRYFRCHIDDDESEWCSNEKLCTLLSLARFPELVNLI